MTIAIIGSGISGLVAAYLLSRRHEVTLFEAGSKLGGHTNTIEVPTANGLLAIDTGFIVYNDRTYPNFIRLLDQLGVATQPSDMSFSVQCARTGLEYNGDTLNTLFAQRRNLLRPAFYSMLREILRFNANAPKLLQTSQSGSLTLGAYLKEQRFAQSFIEQYIIPMGAAIWSTAPPQMLEFPARTFIQFFQNHGLLSIRDRPQWRVIQGGSCRYIEKLVAQSRFSTRLNTPVEQVTRTDSAVQISTADGIETFDHVILAAHSDQSLAMLADASAAERQILGTIAYQPNEAVLHTDISLLPHNRRAWASWNCHLDAANEQVALTYHMNRLQSLPGTTQYCVTLNRTAAIAEAQILRKIRYHHPVFNAAAIAAQKRHAEINGQRRTYYCGAYWGYGFHEDGVNSALAVCRTFGIEL